MYTEKGDAIVVLTAIDTSKSVSEIGEVAKSKALKSKAVIVHSAGDTIVNSNKAYLMRLQETDRKDVFLEVIWIKFEDNVFQLAGVFTKPNNKVVHETLLHFQEIPNG